MADIKENADNNKRIKERWEKRIKSLTDQLSRLEDSLEKQNLNSKTDQELEEYGKILRDLRSKIQNSLEEMRKAIQDVQPLGGKAKKELLETFQDTLKDLTGEVNTSKANLDIEKFARYQAMSRVQKWWKGPQLPSELSHLPKVEQEIDNLETNYGAFSKKVEEFKKREGLEKVEMNMSDLEYIEMELKRFSGSREQYLKNVVEAASRVGIIMRIEKKENELTGMLVVDVKQYGDKVNPFLASITTLNTLGESINALYTTTRKRQEETEVRVAKFKDNMEKIKKEALKIEKEVRSKVQAELKEKRDRVTNSVKNLGALATTRARYTPLTSAEAEVLRRKREYFDELRIQQELSRRTNADFNLTGEIIALSKRGALKAEQISNVAISGATEVISELGAQGVHLADMTIGGPIAIPIKAVNGMFDFLAKITGYPGALFEKSRDDYLEMIQTDRDAWKKDNTGTLGQILGVGKWALAAIPYGIGMAIGGPFRLVSKICDGFRSIIDYDHLVKEHRALSWAAGAIGALALVGLTIGTLGFIWIPIAGGSGLGTAHSVKRAVERAAESAKEVINLELSPDNAQRLALYEYDNPIEAKKTKEIGIPSQAVPLANAIPSNLNIASIHGIKSALTTMEHQKGAQVSSKDEAEPKPIAITIAAKVDEKEKLDVDVPAVVDDNKNKQNPNPGPNPS